MDITVYQQVDVTGMTDKQIEIVKSRNVILKPNEHAPTCPVYHGASADCVWPLAICYATNLGEVYNVNHHIKRGP